MSTYIDEDGTLHIDRLVIDPSLGHEVVVELEADFAATDEAGNDALAPLARQLMAAIGRLIVSS